MNKIVRVLIGRPLKILNKSYYYHTTYGVKVINRPAVIDSSFPQEIIQLQPSELHLGMDFLKDPYTLLNKPLSESPHFYMVNKCRDNCLDETDDYIIRRRNGYLDNLDSLSFSSLTCSNSYRKKEMALKNCEGNDHYPILFYVVDDVKYILDGKHRASMALLFSKPLEGIKVPLSYFNPIYLENLIREMKYSAYEYEKNHAFIKKILGSEN